MCPGSRAAGESPPQTEVCTPPGGMLIVRGRRATTSPTFFTFLTEKRNVEPKRRCPMSGISKIMKVSTLRAVRGGVERPNQCGGGRPPVYCAALCTQVRTEAVRRHRRRRWLESNAEFNARQNSAPPDSTH